MSTTTELRGTARIKIHDGKLDEFKQLVERCVEVVRTKEAGGTLEYGVYLSGDGREAFVHERYRDSVAGLAHMENIGDLAKQMAKVCTMTGEVCGEPQPELRAALEKAGVTIYAPLSFAR